MIYTSVFFFTDCLIYFVYSEQGEVIKYYMFIFVVVIELSVRCLNTGPEDRLTGLYIQWVNMLRYWADQQNHFSCTCMFIVQSILAQWVGS